MAKAVFTEGTWWDGYQVGLKESQEKAQRANTVKLMSKYKLMTENDMEAYRAEVVDSFLEFIDTQAVDERTKKDISVLAERFLTEEQNE